MSGQQRRDDVAQVPKDDAARILAAGDDDAIAAAVRAASYNRPRPSERGLMWVRRCAVCRAWFQASNGNALTCSAVCRKAKSRGPTPWLKRRKRSG